MVFNLENKQRDEMLKINHENIDVKIADTDVNILAYYNL